jgi:hypothetical protein
MRMRDIRYAIRSLVKTPTVTLPALVILALGIGATTAIFTVANSVLVRPLPFADPERLVQVGTIGILEFQTYREQSQSFASLLLAPSSWLPALAPSFQLPAPSS